MQLWKKFARRMNARSLGVVKNRKCVGKILFYITLAFFAVCAFRIGKIVATGKVGEVVLEKKAKEMYEGIRTVQAKRGTIFDRNGNPIALNAEYYSLKAILSKEFVSGDGKKLYVEEEEFPRVAEVLQKYLKIDPKDSLERLAYGKQKGLYQVEFGAKGREINLTTRQAIQEAMKRLHLEGIQFDEHPGRSYPNGDFASHLIGFIKKNEEDDGISGAFGLEAAYEEELRGVNGEVAYKRDSAGNPMPGTEEVRKRSVNGKDIYTTIDVGLQRYLEVLMEKLYEKQKPENLTAILMSAKSADVLAMSQRPSFNPATKKGFNDKMNWSNIPLQDSFEPGSTMKSITTAVAENEGKFNPGATYEAGVRAIHDRSIGDWDYNAGLRGVHTKTFLQGLAASSNVAMTHLEDAITDDTFHLYLQRFGFGQFLGNGMDGDSYGLLPPKNSPVDMTMSSFGQGITVTQMQMMRAYSAIANDGVMLEPHFLSKVVNPNTQREKRVEPEIMGVPVQAEAARKTREYLQQVVKDHEWGVGYLKGKQKEIYEVPEMNVNLAVKTGTAQVVSNGKYVDKEYLHSAVVMAPAEDPEFVLYVTMKFPQNFDYEAISEITNPLMKEALVEQKQQQNLVTKADEVSQKVEAVSVADYCGKSPRAAENDARHQVLQVAIIGDGTKVVGQSLPAKSKVVPNTRILFRTTGKMQMPDVKCWKKREVDQLAKLMKIKINYSGKGEVVKSQSVPSYLEIKEGERVTIELEEK